MKLEFGSKVLRALGSCTVTSPMISGPLHLCDGDTLELVFAIDVDGPEGILVEAKRRRPRKVKQRRDRRLLLVGRA